MLQGILKFQHIEFYHTKNTICCYFIESVKLVWFRDQLDFAQKMRFENLFEKYELFLLQMQNMLDIMLLFIFIFFKLYYYA